MNSGCFRAVALALAMCLVGCDSANRPTAHASGAVRPAAATSTLSPADRAAVTAIANFEAKAQDEDRSADAAKATGEHWSGSAERAQAGDYLQAGQDITNAQRQFLSQSCEAVAGRRASRAYVRVDRGGPRPIVTCKLVDGALVKVTFNADGEPRRAP